MPAFATHPARPSTVPPAPRTARWLAALHRGLDVLVAFATLRDAEAGGGDPYSTSVAESRAGREAGVRASRATPRAAGATSHPHRRPLRAPTRTRRPGAVQSSPQACTTPLAPTRPSRRPDRVAEPRR